MRSSDRQHLQPRGQSPDFQPSGICHEDSRAPRLADLSLGPGGLPPVWSSIEGLLFLCALHGSGKAPGAKAASEPGLSAWASGWSWAA